MVKGGIAAVVNGYRNSQLEKDFDLRYIESYRDGRKLRKMLKAIVGYLRFIKVLIIEKPDLVHIHSSFGPSFYRKIPFIYLAYLFRIPIINHIHGSDYDTFYNQAGTVKKRIVHRVYMKCTLLVALSDAGRDQIRKIVPPEKIVVLENYSLLHKDALRDRLNRRSNNTVLYMGEIGRRKGCYDIPAIVEQVVKAIPDVSFVICGSGEVGRIKRLLIDRNIQNNVKFPGWVRDKEKDRLFREADVFLLPSYYEGMPMSILDAMGYGLPIVSTDVGGISRIVHDRENGFLCHAGCVADLSRGIIELLQNTELSKAYGENSCIIAGEHSLEAHLVQLAQLYNAI